VTGAPRGPRAPGAVPASAAAAGSAADNGADDFSTTYRSTLEQYVAAGEEHQLEEAYGLGREAFAAGMTLLELIHLHHAAVSELVRRSRSARGRRIGATFEFLAEALATFEMAQRGYWEAQQRARWEHEQSVRLQEDLLPVAVPHIEGLEVAMRYLPGEPGSRAGGDWYDVFELDAGRAGLVVGDITGHGVSAAAAMGQMRIAVLAYALAGHEPAAVVGRVDQLLQRLGTGDIATLVYVVVDLQSAELIVVNAGHPPPLVVEPDGTTRAVLDGHSRLLGLNPPLTERAQPRQPLLPGSHLLLYTDGLVESVERGGDDGVARLHELTEGFVGSAEELCDHVLSALAPKGARDDICIIAATVNGS
jgi:serine phosphatase RsbU (regulator of sigma subunit)